MKTIVEFPVLCTRCGTERLWCVTESELGLLDLAIKRWCSCPVSDIVRGLTIEARARAQASRPDE